MSELHRGQHPHAPWCSNFYTPSGPETWTNKIENDRTLWEEKSV